MVPHLVQPTISQHPSSHILSKVQRNVDDDLGVYKNKLLTVHKTSGWGQQRGHSSRGPLLCSSEAPNVSVPPNHPLHSCAMSMLPRYRLRFARDPSVPTTTPEFESCLHTFSARRNSPASAAHPIAAVVAPPVDVPDPATPERNGSITRDTKRRSPTHEWNSLDEFKTWRMKEQLDHRIELLLVRTISSGGSHWHEKRIYVCSRQGTGRKSKSIGKHLERIRSRPSTRTGCRCRVIVKTYPHTSIVLGWYRTEHDHATGILNLGFTRLQDSTRAYAPGLLRHMKPEEVVSHTY